MWRLTFAGLLILCICFCLTAGVYDGHRQTQDNKDNGDVRVILTSRMSGSNDKRNRGERPSLARLSRPQRRRYRVGGAHRRGSLDADYVDRKNSSTNENLYNQRRPSNTNDGDRSREGKRVNSKKGHGHGRIDHTTDKSAAGAMFKLGGGKGRLDKIYSYWQKNGLSSWLSPVTQGSINLGEGIGVDWNFRVMVDEIGREWWTGPNVCRSRVENEKNMTGEDGDGVRRHSVFSSTVCDQTHSAYTCTTKTGFLGKIRIRTVSYQCCHGFQRREGQPGCIEALELTDIPRTLRRLEVTNFVKALDSLGIIDELANDNYTVFAPTNNASETFLSDKLNIDVIRITPELLEMGKQMEAVLGAHVIHGFFTTAQTRDEQLLTTGHPKAKIRINTYDTPNRLVTANCQPLSSSDNLASNGVIHVVDGLLMPITDTITDIISKSPELSTLKTILGKTGMATLLQGEGQYTMFAPTNDAFASLEADTLYQLLESTRCVSSVINHHLLPNVICSSVITRRARTANQLGKYLVLDQLESGFLTVGDAQIIQKDLMASNGVIHLIDKVLVPDEALDILQLASRAGATKMVELIERIGISKTIRTAGNFTLFLPTNEAIEDVPFNLTEDPALLAKIIKYHILDSPVPGRMLHNDQKFETMSDNKALLIKEYSSHMFGRDYVKTAQCSPLSQYDIESCHGIAHVVDKMLLPPGGDLVDVLYQDQRFSKLVELLKQAGDLVEELQRADGLTFFAPTNAAFRDMRRNDLAKLEENPDDLKRFLQHHLIPDVLCCAGIFETHWFLGHKEHTLGGSAVKLQRDGSKITVGGVPIATCDISATNGVVHAVDQPLQSSRSDRKGGRTWNNLREILTERDLKWQDVFDLDLDVDWDFDWNRRK